jgi:hypothetical protein
VVCLAFFAFLSASIRLPASSFRAPVSVAAAFVERETSVELARLEASRSSRVDGSVGTTTVADWRPSIAKAPVQRPNVERAPRACWTPRPKTQAELMVFLI